MNGLVRLACITAVLMSTSAAVPQEGPLRQRLRERLQQRPPPAADAGAAITAPGDHVFALEHDGRTRKYRVHVPRRPDAASPMPLVVALHGGGGNMDLQADDARYGIVAKSDREGFVAVFPNGTSRFKNGRFATWNAGTCCAGARDDDVDDVGFIRTMVTDVSRRLPIDPDRVYATGMSNGGLMAYRLACEMSDVFKAIAPVAGTDNTRTCTPRHPVSVLHIHARNDPRVLYDGGAGPDSRDLDKVTDFTSVHDTVAKWVALDGCAPTPRRVLEKPGAWCDLYAPCREGTKVQLCVTETGGHSWPGGSKRRGEAPSQAIAADDVMWEFFSAGTSRSGR
jgi:polyhydroxybutyrate depolymerase